MSTDIDAVQDAGTGCLHGLTKTPTCVRDSQSCWYRGMGPVRITELHPKKPLERKLRKLKERSIMKGNWPGKAGPHVDVGKQQFQEYYEQVVWDTVVFTEEERTANTLEEINREYPQQIVRSKTLALEPISVSDAVDQLEQLGHDFYVFCEKETGAIQVLYKRKAEGYGLLIPKNAK